MNVRTDKVTVFIARKIGNAYELLQLRRCDGEPLTGTWQTVRGTMEAGETSVQTALRELREETGLVPLELYHLGIPESFHMLSDDTIYHAACFAAIVAGDSNIIFDSEHDAHRWFPAADAERFFLWPSERPLLDVLHREILNDGNAKQFLRVKL
jgi:dATP pyrophosphohydrolase